MSDMHFRNSSTFALCAFLALTAACGATDRPSRNAGAPACAVVQQLQPLPEDGRETSGLTVGRRHPDLLWTHNDSGFEPFIYELDHNRTLKAFFRVTGGEVTDWDDMEAGECETGSCLYVADIGDNAGARSSVMVYEIPEPELPATEVAPIRTLHVRYPDGAQDAEAFFRLPSGEMYIVTKGRQGTIKLYRLAAGGGEVLALVREVLPHPENERDRVTAATASPDGKWVAIRTYRTLYIYRTDDLTGDGAAARTFSLVGLNEKQGESVTLANDGSMWLTSEAEDPKDMPMIGRLSCALE